MDASKLILNLVQKAAIKTEINEKSLYDCELLSDHGNDPPTDQLAVIKNSFACDSPEKSCDDCKKEPKEAMFKVSLTTTDENLESDKENASRKKIRVEARQICGNREKGDDEKIFVLQQLDRSQIRPEGFPAFLCIDGRIADSNGLKRKIPRPANAFMLFANEWRKKLAAENPRESNKDISVRLGILWKNMAKDVKEKYFALAREVDAEHKRKYPDYVYNPKEARLRKAMREQSRELSRRSILQSAIARAGVISGPITSSGFLDHQHRFGCVSTANVPMNSSVESDRVTEPWFQSTPRPKPIHSPRMTDWYGNVGEPIERLQVMGTMHQRGHDKCKDTMRNQAAASVVSAAECGGATFSNNGYAVDFSDIGRERELRRQENIAEYAEFADGQKWHPYQNGTSHQHPRTSHPSQVAGILHPNVQSPSSHGHGPWSQFFHGALPHAPPMPRNIGVRGPRHTVLLRDRLPGRHCEFPEDATRLTYNPTKLDVENVRASYSPSEHQMSRLLESSVDSAMESASTSRIRREDEGPRWEPNSIGNGIAMDNLAPTESSISREKERESRRSTGRFEPKKKTVSKQPLPGFHQAFGSTEIGRFSRSEFFVNMVGESGGNVEVTDTEGTNVSTDRMSEVNGAAVTAATHDTAVVTATATTTVRTFDGEDSEEASLDSSNNELVAPTSMYCEQPSTTRWHSPHVGAIEKRIPHKRD